MYTIFASPPIRFVTSLARTCKLQRLAPLIPADSYRLNSARPGNGGFTLISL
jgi:hypothetical protein